MAIRGANPCSRAISSAISSVQSSDWSQPEVPHDPISSGMPAFSRARIRIARSAFTAAREYFATPLAR